MTDLMALSAVPNYILEKTGVKRSRQTVYNWVSKGVKNTEQTFKLRTETKAGQVYTRADWIDTFLSQIDQ